MVTHRSTNPPASSLSSDERTGISVFCSLWPYVLIDDYEWNITRTPALHCLHSSAYATKTHVEILTFNDQHDRICIRSDIGPAQEVLGVFGTQSRGPGSGLFGLMWIL